jgi:hypothetical protein
LLCARQNNDAKLGQADYIPKTQPCISLKLGIRSDKPKKIRPNNSTKKRLRDLESAGAEDLEMRHAGLRKIYPAIPSMSDTDGDGFILISKYLFSGMFKLPSLVHSTA